MSILLGSNSQGTGSASLLSGYIFALGPFTPNENGDVNQISGYFTDAGKTIQFAIYSDVAGVPTARLAYTATGTSAANAWLTIALNTPVTLSTGSQYWLCINDNGVHIGDTAGTGLVPKYVAQTYGTWPDPITGTANSGAVNQYAIYADASVSYTTHAVDVTELWDNGYDNNTDVPKQSQFSRFRFTTNSPTIQVTGTSTLYGTGYNSFCHLGVRTSTDGGTTWTQQSSLVFTGTSPQTFTVTLTGVSTLIEITSGMEINTGTVGGSFITSVRYVTGSTFSVSSPTVGNRVLIYGDSITGMNSDYPEYHGWSTLLRDVYGYRTMLEAWGTRLFHDDCPSTVTAFVSRLAGYTPNIIWISIGVNDYAIGGGAWSAANFGTRYGQLLAALNAALPNAKIICQTPVIKGNGTTDEAANANYSNTLGDYRAAIVSAAAGKAYAYVVDGLTILASGDLDTDKVHPTTAGHVKYALFVSNWLAANTGALSMPTDAAASSITASSAALSVSAASGGTAPYTYQWEISPDGVAWTPIAGATSLTPTITGLTSNTAYHVMCVATDAASNTASSNSASFTTLPPPYNPNTAGVAIIPKTSYANLGGSVSRCTPLFSASAVWLSAASGPPATVTYTIANSFTAADYGNRLVRVTKAGVTVVCQITAATSTTLTLNQTTAYGVSGASTTLPTTGTITITSGGPFLMDVATSGFSMAADCRGLLDGLGSAHGTGLAFNSTSLTGTQTITFDFGTASGWDNTTGLVVDDGNLKMQKIVTEFTWWQYAGSYSQGVWTCEASNDGTTWVSMTGSANFTLASSTTGATSYALIPPGSAWTTGYRYYRLRGISGTTQASNVPTYQITFKVDDFAAAVTVDQPTKDTATALAQQAVDQCYRLAANPTSETWPTGIAYADDFSTGWASLAGTPGYYGASPTVEYSAVRFGSVSASVVSSSASGTSSAYVEKKFTAPLDLSNSDVILGLCLTAVGSMSPKLQNRLVVSLHLADINGHYADITFPSNLTTAQDWTGWLPRFSRAMNFGPDTSNTVNGLTGGVTGSNLFDITKITDIQVRTTLQASDTTSYTVAFDSLIFAQKPTQAEIMFRSDPSSYVATLQLMDWCNANAPSVKICATLDYKVLDVNDTTSGKAKGGGNYGWLASAYLAQQAYGHRVTHWSRDQGTKPQNLDTPLSQYSACGEVALNRYLLEGCGFVSDDVRAIASGSSLEWNPALQAEYSQYINGWWQALSPVGQSQYVNDYILATVDLTDSSQLATVQTAIKDAVEGSARCVIFGHIQGDGTGGAHEYANDSLSPAKTFITNYILPALSGTLVAGYTTPARMVTIGQAIQQQGSSSGGGGSGGSLAVASNSVPAFIPDSNSTVVFQGFIV